MHNQRPIRYRIHCSGKSLNHSITSCNTTQSPPVSICKISKQSVQICKFIPVTSGSPSRKNLSILDMSKAIDDPIMEESFRRLLNEFVQPGRFPFGRSRPVRRQQAKKPRRMSSAEAGDRRKNKYATIIANFRKQRMMETKPLSFKPTNIKKRLHNDTASYEHKFYMRNSLVHIERRGKKFENF